MRRDSIVRAIVKEAHREGCVVTRADAFERGATDRLLAELVAAGILARAHRGVYFLASASAEPIVMIRAAIVAVGAGTLASHATAAWLQGLVEQKPATIHLTITGRRPALTGVSTHVCRELPPSASYLGIRCTLPARTILDMASTCAPAEIERAIDHGLAKGVLRLADVEKEAAPSAKRSRGAARVRRHLEASGRIAGPTPSVLESMMARVFTRYCLPAPKAELHAGPDGRFRIDYAYAPEKLAVELFGYAWHHSPEQMARDLARQRALVLEGWTVLVFTWQDVRRDPARVAAEIRAALSPRS
jgi:hypothetical protein